MHFLVTNPYVILGKFQTHVDYGDLSFIQEKDSEQGDTKLCEINYKLAKEVT